MVDIHSHILHNVFDSPTSIDISLKMAKQYVNHGFTHIVSTPHFNPLDETIESFLLKCDHLYYEFNKLLQSHRVNLKIIRGAEVMLYPELINMRDISRLCVEGTSYMLVELPWNQFPLWSSDVLFQLELNDIVPILAHPERNKEIFRHYGLFTKLVNSGLLTQINAISIFKRDFRKKMIRWLFSDNAVSFIATDCHMPDERIEKFNKAIRILKRRYGKNRIARIINESSLLIDNYH